MTELGLNADPANQPANYRKRLGESSKKEAVYSLLGITVSMGCICFTSAYLKQWLLIPSLASSAIMVFLSYNNAFAQPRNIVGGHLTAALAAIITTHFWGQQWWAITLVVALSAFLMIISDTIHPPGGGTAIAVFLGGYSPTVLLGVLVLDTGILVLAAFLINNALPTRKYPLFWM